MNQPNALGTRSAPARRPGFRGESIWRVPAALVALTAIPLIAGSLRLLEVAGGPQLLPTNPRIDASPAPLVLHVVAAAVFASSGRSSSPPACDAATAPGIAEPAACSSQPVWPSPAPGSG